MLGAQVAMKLAFWKSKRSRPSAADRAPAEPQFDSAAGQTDADAGALDAQRLRVRTRRRLIGAFALLLAVVVIVPMLLDPAPRAVPDNIPIDLPRDTTPFTPALGANAPGVPAADSAPAAEGAALVPAAPGSVPDAAPPATEPVARAPATAPAAAPAAAAAVAPTATSAAPAAPAAKPEPAASRKHAAEHPAGKIFVQAAALANENAAKELAARITKAGYSAAVERTDTAEGARFRVRVGPYASKQEAEHARTRLKAIGVSGNIVGAG